MMDLDVATMEARSSQAEQILAYMKKGNRINPQKALQMFGCLRLAARISDLKKYNTIKSETVTYKKDGKIRKYKEYWLAYES